MEATKSNENLQSPRRGRRGAGGRPAARGEKPKPEFDQQMLAVRRVARVVRGGRRFSFSAVLVAGDRRGRVGLGVGKGADVTLAVEKAFRQAKKNMITLGLTKEFSLPHEVGAKFGASQVFIKPAPGRGLVAGSAPRTIMRLAGVRDVSVKILSKSKNKLNNARATIEALSTFRT